MLKGKIINLSKKKSNQFGFISFESSNEKVYFNEKSCSYYKKLSIGDLVEFELHSSAKGPFARNVKLSLTASEVKKIRNEKRYNAIRKRSLEVKKRIAQGFLKCSNLRS